jgi:very-short-patch-repair endonuclease
MKAQIEHLLDYLIAVEELKQTAPRQIPTDWLALHQIDLKGLDGVHFNQRAGDQDVWLKVERLEETPPPQPKPVLEPWVQLTRSPKTEPSLKSSILVAHAKEDEVETIMLDNRPDIRPLFEAYLIDWKAWAEREIRRRKTIAIYRKLFLLQQTISTEGGDQPLELVWGMAIAAWNPPDTSSPILHPLITQSCEISINAKSYAVEIRPSVSRPKLEVACYAQLGLAGVAQLEISWRALRETGGDVMSPFEESSFREMATTAVTHLDPDGRYESRAEDLSLPVTGNRLVATSTWCLFARKRTGDLIIDDIKALKQDVQRTTEFPQLAKRFVQPLTGAVSQPRAREYRGISSSPVRRKSEEQTNESPIDLLFPLPYNDEQVAIVQRLDYSDGVVVQGPPGTGKSHTIANIICHVLANGGRILVTAKSDSALAVLRDKLPKEIRPLTVSLLSSEADGNRQFEANVRTIDEELSRLDEERATSRIMQLQADIDRQHEALADADRQIDAMARPNIQPVRIDGNEVAVMELARQVVEAEPRHKWFNDVPAADPDPSLTEGFMSSLRLARRRAGEGLKFLQDVYPAQDALPTADELIQTHRDLRRATELDTDQRQGQTLALREVTGAVLSDLPKLRQTIVDRQERESLLARHSWAQRLVAELRRVSPTDPVVATLRELVASIGHAEQQRRAHVAKALEVPEGAEADSVLRQAIARLASGGRAFKLPIGHGEQRKILAQIRVAGVLPTQPEQWTDIDSVLAWRDELRRTCAKWSSLADELDLPAVNKGTASQIMRELSRLSDIARTAVESVFNHDRTLVQWIAKTFALSPETAPAAALSHLDRIMASIDAHLEHSAVTYALERRRVYLEKLNDCRGDLAISLSTLFSGALGSEMEQEALRVRWRELTEELHRRTQLGSALRTIREGCAQIANAGAPLWAERLRTQPQDVNTDRDPLIPNDWAEAWQWRRSETFLRRIDAHQELRRLFAERAHLSKTLANTYQDLAAARTWLAVSKHAGYDVRAALKAYLSAILEMGKGLGKNAVLLRRDAKRAMASAYMGVPCWILPHWRVSEALPSKLGLFDLVIVDEASQSDLSCMPAILRGKKLLVVGDDMQVSPSNVGMPVETLADLRQRYLSGLPENIGPLMLPGRSLYDLANVVFAGQGVMLREHFRSVAPIIEWSNQEYYHRKIIPLRVPSAAERLDPPLVDVFVRGGKRKGDVNALEAQAVVDEIKTICDDPTMAGRTIGVVTLMGIEQAHHIHALIGNQIPPSEVLARQISVGPPPVFQGRERHIMLISMVLDKGSNGLANAKANHQRHNVALSRAQDRMVLFRSIEESDVNPASLTAKVLAYFRNPTVSESPIRNDARDRCESPFEMEVYDELVARGFRVVPQVKAGPYRIDLVVEDKAGRRLAVECDGDRYHGPGQWSDDMARQRVLERAGWTFWRCFASTWTRRRQECVADLLASLERQGIGPAPPTSAPHLVEKREYVPYANRSRAQEDEVLEVETTPSGDADEGPEEPESFAPAPAKTAATDNVANRPFAPDNTELLAAMLDLMPSGGSAIGNQSLRRNLELRGFALSEGDYFSARQILIDRGLCETGRGRGGSVRRLGAQGSLIRD